MKSTFDSFLENFFGGYGPLLNTAAGVVVLVVGVILLRSSKKRSSKGKNTAALICIGVGCLAFVSGVIQLLIN
jgi:amino acid permease